MATLTPLMYEDGTNSLSVFMQELKDKHKNEDTRYIAPFIKVLKDFKEYGSRINNYYSKKFPPYKTMPGTDFAELRTKECRYFIYHTGNNEWIGLHGYEKQGDKTPKNEINRAKREIKQWERTKQKK